MSDVPLKRVSYTDIAKRSGYHRSTVGLALTKDPGIPEKTRVKIQKIAQEMGYRPDPALSSLATYRRQKRIDQSFTTIALIADVEINSKWKEARHSRRDYYLGIRQRADELGFSVEEFSLGIEDRRYEERVDSVLRSRGIRAMIVCPLLNQWDPIHLKWEDYSSVCIGYTLKGLNIIRVCSQNRMGAFDAVVELYGLGYRKLGLVLGQVEDSRVNYAWSSGFYGACHHPEMKGLDYAAYMPKSTDDLTSKVMLQWVKKAGVDAVIVAQKEVFHFLKESGISIPEELGVACLDLPPNCPELAGIDQHSLEIGRQAVDQVAGLYMNNDLGVPTRQLIHGVKGEWMLGASVRPR